MSPTASRVPSTATRRITTGSGVGLALAAVTVAGAVPAAADEDHVVASGETVSHLALRYGTTTAAIVQVNGLDQRASIRTGQHLTIPTGSGAAPQAAAPAAAPAATYTVVSGDTVSHLAARFGTTVGAIVAANGLDQRAFIREGQVLSIPTGTAPAPAAAAPVASPAPATSGSYTVVSGDTVSALATRFGTTVAAIVAANGLDQRAFIRQGQTLSIPGAGAAPTTTSGLVGDTFAGRTYPAATVASANQNKATLLAVGVPSRADMQALVTQVARDMGVDPALAQAIAYQESGFNHASVSPANAIGTMQVIPTSGQWASELVGRDLNLLDPTDNVVAGVAILRQLLRSADDLPSAIAGYYQGLSSVTRNGMYDDTRRYVANVQTLMSRFA